MPILYDRFIRFRDITIT